jgi:glucose/arabinose dehydrogenase
MIYLRAYLPLLAIGAVLLGVLPACSSSGGGGGGPTPLPTPAFGLTSEVVTPAAQADALAFAPDGRLFYAEHWTGNIRIVGKDGTPLPDPFAHIDSLWADIEVGLTGIALDPAFATNHYVYAMYTKLTAAGPPKQGHPVVVRYTDANNVGTDMKVIIDNLPDVNEIKAFNANGALGFGPDGYLYLTLGDYDKPADKGPSGIELAQDLSSPIGKILRVNKADGSAAPDNPFVSNAAADGRIFAYGFRGPFNFTWNSQTKALYGADSTGNTCEGVDIILAGGNYGWPNVGGFPFSDCTVNRPNLPFTYLTRNNLKPEDFDSTVGARGMAFISGNIYPALGDSLAVCESRTQEMRRLVLTPPKFDAATANDFIANDCWLDATVGPDGLLYYSNLTEIRKLIPPSTTTSQPSG